MYSYCCGLMVAGVFSANAQSSTTVPEAQWKAGNYYYLKTGSSVLSLSGEKADSVIVKTFGVRRYQSRY